MPDRISPQPHSGKSSKIDDHAIQSETIEVISNEPHCHRDEAAHSLFVYKEPQALDTRAGDPGLLYDAPAEFPDRFLVDSSEKAAKR